MPPGLPIAIEVSRKWISIQTVVLEEVRTSLPQKIFSYRVIDRPRGDVLSHASPLEAALTVPRTILLVRRDQDTAQREKKTERRFRSRHVAGVLEERY